MKVRDLAVYLAVALLVASMLVSVASVAHAQETTSTPTETTTTTSDGTDSTTTGTPTSTPTGTDTETEGLTPGGDADDDGVINRDDECPETRGERSNNGCPQSSGSAGDLTQTGNDLSASDITVFDISDSESEQVTVQANVGDVQIIGLNWKAEHVIVELRTKPSVNQSVPATLTPKIACPSGVCEPEQARILVPAEGAVRLKLDAPPMGLNNDQAFSIGTPKDFKIVSDPDEPLVGDGKIVLTKAGIGVAIFFVLTVAAVGYSVYRKQQIGDPKSAVDGTEVTGKYGFEDHEIEGDNDD